MGLPQLQAAYELALRTGSFEEVQAALAALYTAAGDKVGAAWATQGK